MFLFSRIWDLFYVQYVMDGLIITIILPSLVYLSIRGPPKPASGILAMYEGKRELCLIISLMHNASKVWIKYTNPANHVRVFCMQKLADPPCVIITSCENVWSIRPLSEGGLFSFHCLVVLFLGFRLRFKMCVYTSLYWACLWVRSIGGATTFACKSQECH